MTSPAPVGSTPPPDLAATAEIPTISLADAAVADLQLVLLGVTLPWQQLGGSSADAPATTGRVSVSLPEPVWLGEALPPAIALSDRENTPLAILTDLRYRDGWLSGVPLPQRAREAQLFADLVRAPDPRPPGPVLLAARPFLAAELAALPEAASILVPVENATADGLAPAVLLRALRVDLAEGTGAKLIAIPLFWRDPTSNAALCTCVLAAYAGQNPTSAPQLLAAEHPDWQAWWAQLEAGQEVPPTLTAAATRVLQKWRPPKPQRGLVLLCTGFSGSGKSTVARDIAEYLAAYSERTVTLLDGDDVRRMLSAGLGFDRAARELNVRRIGFVASEIARHGGIAICAPIAPYAEIRAEVRTMVAPLGDFQLLHISTPLAECERRDLKGLYAKARAGVIPEFTGISDPYDVPVDADLTIDTSITPRAEALARVVAHLQSGGWLTPGDPDGH